MIAALLLAFWPISFFMTAVISCYNMQYALQIKNNPIVPLHQYLHCT